MKIVLYFIIQFLWFVIIAAVGGYISSWLFGNTILRFVFGGIFSVLIYFLLCIITEWFKAMRDPDVLAASDLKMSVKRYRHYRQIYDEYHEFMKMHGTDTPASERKFRELFMQIKNPNEWRRYQQYRYNLAKSNNFFSNDNLMPINIGDSIKLPMEGGGCVIGRILKINLNNTFVVGFPFPVSIMPVNEPVGGFYDNAYPSKQITLSRYEIEGIIKGEYEGTENHYHF